MLGQIKNSIEAYAWGKFSGLNRFNRCLALRDQISQTMTSLQLKQAHLVADQLFNENMPKEANLSLSRAM